VESKYFPQLAGVFQRSRVLVKVASERGGRGVIHAPLLHEAGITCSLSTDERNDEVITPTSEQIQDMRWWEWAIMEIQSGVSGYDGNSKSF
jgi:hypothetical protein